jgi:hypothetical protein
MSVTYNIDSSLFNDAIKCVGYIASSERKEISGHEAL